MGSATRRLGLAIIGVAALGALAGCYDRELDGGTIVYHFSSWTGPVVILLGVAMLPGGWLLRKVSMRLGVVMMIMAPIVLVLAGPETYVDRVEVSKDGFYARYGFWFSPSVHDVKFADLREIRYVETRDSKNRVQHELQCARKSGETEVVHEGTLVTHAVSEIFAAAKAAGVRVVE